MNIDPDGTFFFIPIIAICMIVGALALGTAGGIVAYNIASANGATGWDLFGWTMLGIFGGALLGAGLGYLVAPFVAGVTGIAGFSITSAGITTVSAGSGGGVVLWSGGQKLMEAATNYASNTGATTLEQTFSGKFLSAIQNFANSTIGPDKAYNLLRPFWDVASSRFVQGTVSQVHVFLNSAGISDTSVFMRIEYQELKQKGVEIVYHLLNGG